MLFLCLKQHQHCLGSTVLSEVKMVTGELHLQLLRAPHGDCATNGRSEGVLRKVEKRKEKGLRQTPTQPSVKTEI